jgi:regulator of replication initiation timing
LFNTSDTGSEFDPISGSFIDKKAVRRERNKLAAQGYRQRKRATVETIEVELEEVRKQNTALQQQNTVLQTENGLLREQLEFFRKALSGNLGSR